MNNSCERNADDAVTPRVEQETDWARLEAMTGEEALRNALADPDNPPLTDAQLSRLQCVPNPREIRHGLRMTQREFARQFQIALGTLRDWEQGARRPDSAAMAYLRVIAAAPDVVRRIVNPKDREEEPLRNSAGLETR